MVITADYAITGGRCFTTSGVERKLCRQRGVRQLPTAFWRPTRSCTVKLLPVPAERATEPSIDDERGTPARISWARLRVFDIEHCPNCGGALKIIAAIEDPPVIVKILTHLGLPTRAPPCAPEQRFDLFQTV